MSKSLLSQRRPLSSPGEQRRVLEPEPGQTTFREALQGAGHSPLRAGGLEIFQINLGKLCNQTCAHCHVDAGPDRTEVMSRETMEACLKALDLTSIPTVDITGGAPELVPGFRWLVEEIRMRGRHVMDRCNLTILTVPQFEDLPDFFARHQVEVVASLPYYLEQNTDAQRGQGVFSRSIDGLQRLNAVGYGQEGSGLELNLVYNPVGAFLPPAQKGIEADYRRELKKRHGIVFNRLFAITNMPISRFLEFLLQSGNFSGYMERLIQAFNPATVEGLMCRQTLSVGWDGRLFDCDFNQMLDLPTADPGKAHIHDFDPGWLASRPIVTGQHCFGCTAGSGSSCGGTLTES